MDNISQEGRPPVDVGYLLAGRTRHVPDALAGRVLLSFFALGDPTFAVHDQLPRGPAHADPQLAQCLRRARACLGGHQSRCVPARAPVRAVEHDLVAVSYTHLRAHETSAHL
eukprot:15464800-Alexandrium_andersonii.AAC.1